MDPQPLPVEPTPLEVPGASPIARWRKILRSLFIITVVVPVVWAIGLCVAGVLLDFMPSDWRSYKNTLLLLAPSVVSLLVAWWLLRSGLRRDLPVGRGQLAGWGAAATVMAGLAALAAVGMIKVRDSSKLKSMLPRQPAAAIDQFYLENPNRIFIQYDEIFGPDRYMRHYSSVDGEDLRDQFPIRQSWFEPLSVRLPDGTTVRRYEVLAAIGKSGLIATYPQPQEDQYDPKRVYRLDCGVSFRDGHVVDLPPDPVGREGRDQDGVHTYQFPDGRRFEVTYRGGVPDGLFRAFYADGKPWGEATYRQGKVVEAWVISRQGRRFNELKDSAAASEALLDEAKAEATRLTARGREKLSAKDFAGAAADLNAAMDYYQFDSSAYLVRADARAALGDFAGAIEDAKRARDYAENDGERSLGEQKLKEIYTRQAAR